MFSDVEIETPPLADSRPDRTHQSVHPLRIRTPQSLDPLQQEREKGHFSFSGILRGSSNPFRPPIPIYDMTFPEPRTCNLHVHDLTGHFRASSPSSFPVFVRSGSRSSTGMIVRTGIPPSAPNPVPLLCVLLCPWRVTGEFGLPPWCLMNRFYCVCQWKSMVFAAVP